MRTARVRAFEKWQNHCLLFVGVQFGEAENYPLYYSFVNSNWSQIIEIPVKLLRICSFANDCHGCWVFSRWQTEFTGDSVPASGSPTKCGNLFIFPLCAVSSFHQSAYGMPDRLTSPSPARADAPCGQWLYFSSWLVSGM